MKNRLIAALLALTMTASPAACENAVAEQVSVDGDDILTSSELTTGQTYPSPVVTTGQTQTFNKDGNVVELEPGNTGYGQDGNYDSTSFAFVDNGDGTITTIEGNTSGAAGGSCVAIHNDRSRSEVYGYATPVKNSK